MAQANSVYTEGSVLKLALYRFVTNSNESINVSDNFQTVESAIAMVGVPGTQVSVTIEGTSIIFDASDQAHLVLAPGYVLVQGVGRP